MKRMINFVVYTLVATMMVHMAEAQIQTSESKQAKKHGSKMTDTTLCQRMKRDLSSRDSATAGQQIEWRSSGNGYYGTYSTDSVQHMARYDKNGKFEETLTKKEWNNDIPSQLKSSFDQSAYKSQKVTGFWEINDPSRKGYYLELSDNENQPSEVWAGADGKFSETTSYVEPTPKSNSRLLQDSSYRKNHK